MKDFTILGAVVVLAVFYVMKINAEKKITENQQPFVGIKKSGAQ